MILRFEKEPMIDNLRNYPAEIVAKLRALLTSGAEANPDPHRRNFYDVMNGSRTYYIHVAPSGKVLLLASWEKSRPGDLSLQPEVAA